MIATSVIFLSLGLDTFAVALGLGLSGMPRSRWWRVGLTFACFEGAMPIVGLLIGDRLGGLLGAFAAYLAAAILIALGLYELREALTEEEEEPTVPAAPQRPLLLTGLSVSLDELAVGFTLGVLHVPLGPALAYIAVQAFALTFVGLALGRRLGAHLEERAELAAGIIFVLLGIALIISEATGSHFL